MAVVNRFLQASSLFALKVPPLKPVPSFPHFLPQGFSDSFLWVLVGACSALTYMQTREVSVPTDGKQEQKNKQFSLLFLVLSGGTILIWTHASNQFNNATFYWLLLISCAELLFHGITSQINYLHPSLCLKLWSQRTTGKDTLPSNWVIQKVQWVL